MGDRTARRGALLGRALGGRLLVAGLLTGAALVVPAAGIASAQPAFAPSPPGLTQVMPAPAAVAAPATPAAVAAPATAAARVAIPVAIPAVIPAAPAPSPPPIPAPSAVPAVPGTGDLSVSVGGGDRNQAINIILLMTVLSVAPALLLMTTAFTKIAVVLSLTRNAIGTPTIPPNQVLAGLALFLSLFVMQPVLSEVWDQGVQPYLNNPQVSVNQAFEAGSAPLKKFMVAHTGPTELQTMIRMSGEPAPANREAVTLTTLIPAFVLSELKEAFIIGFVIFVPFLIIDLVVGSALMSMGMMMLPPIMISLPFKLLLFVMVDGWNLITTALVTSYR